jgi:hypothetical protein
MAQITLRVVEGGDPVQGASIVAGTILQRAVTTDGSGEYTKTVAEDYAVVVLVTILVGGDHRHTSGSMLIQAGDTHVFDISHTA